MAEAIGINLKITQMPATRPDGMFSYLNYPKSVETDWYRIQKPMPSYSKASNDTFFYSQESWMLSDA